MEPLKSEVRQLIGKLSHRFDQLPEGPLHPLDADMILSLLRQLYEKTELLRHAAPPATDYTDISSGTEQAKPQVSASSPVAEAVIQPIIPDIGPVEEDPVQHPAQQKYDPVAEMPEPPVNPSVQATSPTTATAASLHEPMHDPAPAVNKPASVPVDLFGTPTIADKLKSETPSLNDTIISGKSDLSLADRIHLKPISDLKPAIGLNDKFQFINDLFEGSTDRYTEALNLLNSCSGTQDAEALLADLKARYHWPDQNAAWKKLREFVVRRYL